MMLTDKEQILLDTPKKRAYRAYCEAIGGKPKPIGLQVPTGYPSGVEEIGGVIAVYEACIKQGCTWEELLDYKEPDPDAIL